MIIIVENKEYKVRHNYLHRWKAELMLEHKEDGQYAVVQFELSDLRDFYDDKRTGLWEGKKYKGYWCVKSGYREIKFSFKEISE
jgi:hypothetical protein